MVYNVNPININVWTWIEETHSKLELQSIMNKALVVKVDELLENYIFIQRFKAFELQGAESSKLFDFCFKTSNHRMIVLNIHFVHAVMLIGTVRDGYGTGTRYQTLIPRF